MAQRTIYVQYDKQILTKHNTHIDAIEDEKCKMNKQSLIGVEQFVGFLSSTSNKKEKEKEERNRMLARSL